jgi:hypothetical protein
MQSPHKHEHHLKRKWRKCRRLRRPISLDPRVELQKETATARRLVGGSPTLCVERFSLSNEYADRGDKKKNTQFNLARL